MEIPLTGRQKAGCTLLLLGCLVLAARLLFFTDWSEIARRDCELDRLARQMDWAQMLSRRAPLLHATKKTTLAALRKEYQSYIAPAADPFPWASQFITLHAARLGLDVRVLTPLSIRAAPWDGLTADARALKLFAVRLDVLAVYAKVASLVGNIEQGNPLVTLTSMSVIDTGRDEGRSRVTMVWEWPQWMDTPDAANARALLRGDR